MTDGSQSAATCTHAALGQPAEGQHADCVARPSPASSHFYLTLPAKICVEAVSLTACLTSVRQLCLCACPGAQGTGPGAEEIRSDLDKRQRQMHLTPYRLPHTCPQGSKAIIHNVVPADVPGTKTCETGRNARTTQLYDATLFPAPGLTHCSEMTLQPNTQGQRHSRRIH